MRKYPLIIAAGLLAGCGADVATTAVTVTKLQAEQTEHAKSQEAQFKKKLGEAMQANNAAVSAAVDQ